MDARLVLLQFTGDTGMPTASTRSAYDAAFSAPFEHLGLDPTLALSGVVHVYQDVAELE